ncbi:MAG: peptide deformylase [Crocinitomicaceae bacterium]|nr:peptide deformylase [Crocinitomicaceae bacterium]|tara:strand:+ start:2319 stop:2915 length:597 start_codon:yes stop_codon:yes gene_type:complete
MILPIVAYGDPILKKDCEEIDQNYPDLKQLISDMFETMYKAKGVGLAAPQIGKNIRLFIVDGSPFADDEDEDEEDDPRAEGIEHFKKVFINPIIEEEDGKEWPFQEGCLSIPKIRENVTRKPDITVSYYDENWELQEESYSGYAARIFQHEYDHIEGILFTDYLSPLKRKLIQKKLNNITNGEIEIDYKMRFPKKVKK